MTVSAGSLEFQISIDRSSLSQALGQVDRAFKNASPTINTRNLLGNADRDAIAFAKNFTQALDPAQKRIAKIANQIKDLANQKARLEFESNADEVLSSIQRESENLSRTRIKLNIDADVVTARLNKIDADLEALQNKRIRLSADPGTAPEVIRKLDAQIQTLEARRVKIDLQNTDARQKIEQVDEELKRLDDRRINVDVDAQRATAGLREIDGELDRLQDEFKRAGGLGAKGFNQGLVADIAIGNILADAAQEAVRVVLDIFRGLGEGINSAIGANVDFENAKAAAATLVDDVDGLTAALDQQRSGLQGQVSEIELLAASYDVLSAGFTEAGEAAEITGASAKGAVAGFSDVGTVTDAVTTILNSYSDANLTASQVVDQLVKTQNLGKITVDQYAQSIGRAASIAATAGVSFEEFNAAVAAATAAGVAPESAVSGIRQAIINLLRPTEDAKVALKEFGIENAAAALKTQGLAGVLQQLSSQNISTEQLTRIFTDVDGLAAIAPIAGANIERFNEALAGIEDASGTTDENLEILTQTIPALQKQFETLTEDGLLAFGKALGPTTAALLTFANQVLEAAAADFGGFDELVGAGERLGSVLGNSPDVVRKLGGAFASLADTAVEQLAAIVDSITAFAGNEAAVDGLASSIEQLGLIIQALGRFIQGSVGAFEVFFGQGSLLENFNNALKISIPLYGAVAVGIDRIKAAIQGVNDLLDGDVEPEAFVGADNSALQGLQAEANAGFDALKSQIESENIKAPEIETQPTEQSAADLEQIAKDALDKLADATDSALAKIETSQAQRIASIKQLQADGVLNEEEAQQQIADAAAETSSKIIAEKQRELAEVQNLKQQGTITEQQAAEEITALQKDIADETLNRIELEIEAQERAKQAALDKLDAELDRVQQLDEIRNIENDIASTALGTQQDLLGAQQELASSRAELANLELQGALERAEAEGRVNDAAAIRGQIFEQQQQAIAQEQQFKQRALDLTIEQNRLEAQRAIQLAEVAAIEADIAVQKARASGASSEEISGLERIASLRDSQVDAARESAANQDAINSALQEQLDVEGQIAQEKLRQSELDDDRLEKIREARDEQAKLNEQLADNRQGIDNALGGAFQTEGDDPRENINSIQNQFRDARSAGLFDNAEGSDFQAVLRELNSALRSGNDRSILQAASSSVDQELFGQLLGQVGRGDLASLVNADAEIDRLKEAQQPIVNELQLLNEQILLLANTPRAISVMTPDPVADAGRIVSDIQRSNAGRVNP